MNIILSDTLTGKALPVLTFEGNVVKMYVCGITPYDYAHVGHGRAYVTFDLLFRFLTLLGYKVEYCRNFTDVDDKLINKAKALYKDPQKFILLAQQFINAFHEDFSLLNCLPPTQEPRVTESIDIIILFIQKLIDKGVAYVSDHDVYFHVPSFKQYAKLSKHKLKDLQAGARVEISEKKKNPLDFALWKHEPEVIFWKSPWGNGRPGWHIECSAMAYNHLGSKISIHGGGMDLMFPHHENEIAQTEALTEEPFAHTWMHIALVRVNKEKMSKSLGNFFTLRDVFKEFDPMIVRFYYLTHHYRTPLDFSFEELKVAQKTYQRLCKDFEHIPLDISFSQVSIKSSSVLQEMVAHLANDLNTPAMFGTLFSHLPTLLKETVEASKVKSFLKGTLGLSLAPAATRLTAITPEIQKLLDARQQARKEKNWKLADQLRLELQELGIEIKDDKIH